MAPDVLIPEHYAQLAQGSGSADAVITERAYRSVTGAEGYAERKWLGFKKRQAANYPGLFLPIGSPEGQQPLTIYRPDTPRLTRNGSEGGHTP